MLYIYNATLLTPKQQIEDAALLIDAGRIIEVGPTESLLQPPAAQSINAKGLTLVPGFIDLQLNGALGHDFTTTPATIWPVAADLPRYGITAFLPTIITSPAETIAAAQKVLQGEPQGYKGAVPLGLHVEGPFFNPAKKGAHNPAYLRPPTLEAVADWSPAQAVRLVTLAPELPGALEVIEVLAGRGVVVSAGHSMATYQQALAGFKAGIRYGTHLFNAMPPIGHREPGLPVALLTQPDLIMGLIPDGVHVHPAVIELIWAVTGPSRLNLISDAMAALGMPPGQYQIGDQAVSVTEVDVRLADGTLAGSILSPDAALRNLIAFTGCSVAEALATLTTTPATLLGLTGQRGQIAPGYWADLVLLSPDLHVEQTIVGGEVVYTKGTGSEGFLVPFT